MLAGEHFLRRKECPTRRLETPDLQPLYQELDPGGPSPPAVRDQRIAIDHPLLLARSRILTLNGLAIIRGTTVARQDLELTSREFPAPVMLSYYIKGRVRGRWPASGLDIESSPGMHGVAFSPEPGFTFRLPQDMRHEIFEVNISRDHLGELAGRYPEIFDGALARALKDDPFAALSRSAAISREVMGIAARILASEDHGPARRAFIEACVVELLALEAGALRGDAPPVSAGSALSSRAVERMEQARSELSARLKEPPTLPELAHLVGTNEFTLKRDFKAAFGSTVFGALFDRRMEIARRMLLETDAGVEEIAEETGYSSAAHFTSAFKRKYGFPPTGLRRRAS